MTVTKMSGMVVVLNDPERDFDESELEEIETLKQRYPGRVIFRDFYMKHRLIMTNGEEREVVTPFYTAEGALNRREIRRQHYILRDPLFGESKTNAQARTKHMRTKRERKLEKARKKR